ncbi:transporter substrate-binding domain-containing protein [Vibrio sp. Of7-15]|uniref:substrate-binding periplasmic protein n=1 Tax=Vibrio sp. Of7-15 TaxID=2724879 RepID=UPI001EF2E6B0|nr:transporter substrate-binding domain-containing protein [Vibrio sp. Of7-15]MCG7495711.1 transporter substrate-binding domain-containing protein [Vibrio sp. Of7-15]
MKVLVLLILAFISSGLHARQISMETTSWEPFYNDTLLNNGVIVEIVNRAFQRVGHDTAVRFVVWRRAMRNVKAGDVDVLVGAYYTKERDKNYRFSDPIFDIDIGFIALKSLNLTHYRKLDDLKGYSIGIGDDWSYGEEFDKAPLKKETVISSTQNVKKLFRNRVDLIAMAIPVFHYERNMLKHNKNDEIVILSPLITSQPLHIMVGRNLKDGVQIIEDFNRGLKAIKADGTYDHLLKKHGFK